MEPRHARTARRTGLAGAAAGVLLFASTAGEIVIPLQEPDGTVVRPALLVLFLGAWIAGALCLAVALRGLGSLYRSAGVPLPRAGRAGVGVALAGSVLLALFGVVFLGTGLLIGTPFEAAFLLFALGFLLLVVGQTMLGLGARRAGAVGAAWVLPIVGAAGALLALGAAADPYHDIGMFVFDGAWVAIGAALLLAARNSRATVPV